MRRYLPFVIIGTVLLAASIGGWFLFRAKHAITPLRIAEGKSGAEPPHVRGLPNAPVTVEEFGDFQCPPCGILSNTLLKVEHDYATTVRVVFREYPLSTVHRHAMTAACAAEAAGLQGHFWEMHDLLFRNAKSWGKHGPPPTGDVTPGPTPAPGASPDEFTATVKGIFAGYAETLGLDVERFKKDMEGEEVQARIKADQDRAASVGVTQTPTLFMNGIQVPFMSLDADDLRRAIDNELSGKKTTPMPTPTPVPSSATPETTSPTPEPTK